MMAHCMALQLVWGNQVNHVINPCHVVASWRLMATDVG